MKYIVGFFLACVSFLIVNGFLERLMSQFLQDISEIWEQESNQLSSHKAFVFLSFDLG